MTTHDRRRTGPRRVTECRCPVAHHQHGTSVMYSKDGCRCDPCTDAKTHYDSTRRRQKAYGRWDNGFVSADRAYVHVHALRQHGIGYRRVAKLAGVRICTIQRLLAGKSATLKAATAAAVLAIPLTDQAQGARTSNPGAMRRVQALMAEGWALSRISAESGINEQTLRDVIYGHDILVRTAEAVKAVYERLWDEAPDTSNGYLAAGVTRTRKLAASRGWAPCMAWDDEAIDDPAAEPAVVFTKKRRTRPAEDIVEDLEWLIRTGASPAEATGRLDMTRSGIQQAMYRAGRPDLARWIHRKESA